MPFRCGGPRNGGKAFELERAEGCEAPAFALGFALTPALFFFPRKPRAFTHHHKPPSARMMSHSRSLTGCTESRAFVTSAMFAKRGSVLMASRLTGFFNASPARTSNRPKFPARIGRIGIIGFDDFDDANDLLAFARVIKEGLLANPHRHQV